MKKLILLLVCIVALQLGMTDAGAISFTFSGSDKGGTGSATMDLTLDDTELTIVLENTSPLTLDDGTGINIPAIVAFGFDVDNDPLPGITSWSLLAYAYNGTTLNFDEVTLGGDPTAGLGMWGILIGGQLEGVEIDYLPNNSGGLSNVDGGLYNPAIAPLPDDAHDSYYTTAVMKMVFDKVPDFDFFNETNKEFSPYVRMQRVGNGGSLKLIGEEDNGGGGTGNPVPEPATMFLLGIGIFGLGATCRKKFMK